MTIVVLFKAAYAASGSKVTLNCDVAATNGFVVNDFPVTIDPTRTPAQLAADIKQSIVDDALRLYGKTILTTDIKIYGTIT